MDPIPEQVTIHDVARAAGVSVATVSRALNGVPTVDPELVPWGRATVAESGYVRDAAGRALRRQVADVWAAIVPDLNTFYTGVVAAFESSAIEHGYSVMLCNSNEEFERERRYAVAAVAQQMAGASLAVTSEADTESTAMLTASMPVVLFDREVRGYGGDCVVVDNEMAGRLVAEHLVAQGCRRPACIVGPIGVSSTEGRLRGYLAAFADAGLTVREEHIARAPLTPDGGGRAMRSLMSLPQPPDATFATTGPLTIGAYQALKDLPAVVGEPVALVGHDDDQWTRIVRPQISVVRQPIDRIGRAVAERLVARAEGLTGPEVRHALAGEPDGNPRLAEAGHRGVARRSLPPVPVRQRLTGDAVHPCSGPPSRPGPTRSPRSGTRSTPLQETHPGRSRGDHRSWREPCHTVSLQIFDRVVAWSSGRGSHRGTSTPRLRRHNEDVHLTVLDGLPADHEAAVHVWHAANIARLRPPSIDRVARIWEKLAESQACLVVGHLVADTDVVAMALAEPGRAEHGTGAIVPDYGHVSMVFVHPDLWGRGVGRQLLQGLHERASERGWNRTTLWTRSSNARARRLYEGQGYRRSGQETTLGSGDPILQLERQSS